MSKGFDTDRFGAYINKDPQSTLDYSIDWTDWMPTGQQIDSSSWTISTVSGDSAPLASSSTTFNASDDLTTVFLTAGTAGNKYTVTNTITTDSGLTDERYFRVFVKNISG